ncbi:hypothetical protein E0J20_09405 [Rhizobium leguminosarum bv. viciae]|nr:hypothetical protein E0J20_09405 [Rhizobium leguminosarum bv. viciae]
MSEILNQVESRLAATLKDLTAILQEHGDKCSDEFEAAALKALSMMAAGTDRTREGITARDHADALSADHTALGLAVELGDAINATIDRVRRIRAARLKNKAVANLLVKIQEADGDTLRRKH